VTACECDERSRSSTRARTRSRARCRRAGPRAQISVTVLHQLLLTTGVVRTAERVPALEFPCAAALQLKCGCRWPPASRQHHHSARCMVDTNCAARTAAVAGGLRAARCSAWCAERPGYRGPSRWRSPDPPPGLWTSQAPRGPLHHGIIREYDPQLCILNTGKVGNATGPHATQWVRKAQSRA
jgi:hypothetical protein